jgi:hypothetical protein
MILRVVRDSLLDCDFWSLEQKISAGGVGGQTEQNADKKQSTAFLRR